MPLYLQFVAGVSEPPMGIRGWQNRMKMSALSHPLKKVCTGFEAERAQREEKEGRCSQLIAEMGI